MLRRLLLLVFLVAGLAGAAAAQSTEYTLSSGDRLRVTVFGEPQLSSEFEIDGTGSFSMPLIGTVVSEGLTVRELEARMAAMLSDGFLRDPRVSVEVLNYRPFYIIGEVNSPGSYPYRAGMTLLNAVAVAGGFTFRANERRVEVTRGDGAPFVATMQTVVLPGDIIRVNQRFF